MAEIDWNQFSKKELVAILEYFEQQPWLVERFDTECDAYLGHQCSCDVGQSNLPEHLVRIKDAAAGRSAASPLDKVLRRTQPSRAGVTSHSQSGSVASAISPTSLYRRIALATGLTSAELPPALLAVLNGSDVSRRGIDDAEADLTDLLDLDNLDHLDIVHDFREFYVRNHPATRAATG